MSNQLMELEKTLETQLILVKEMRSMKDEVAEMREDINRDVKELRDSITLTRSECSEVQRQVAKRAWQLAEDYFPHKVSDDLFMAKVGHFRSAIYNRLKTVFNIPRYYDIRRVDLQRALAVIEMVELCNLKNYQIRLTVRQKEIAAINNDDISALE